MQTTVLNRFTSPVRFFAAGTCAALFAVLTLCLSGALARAQGQGPIAVSGTPEQLGALTGGGWDGSQEPIGGTFVVGVNGDVLVGAGYSANFLQITPYVPGTASSDTTLAAGVGGSAAALDSYGNLYFAGNYNANIYKVPYDAATGQYVGWTGTAPTANCAGGDQDSSPCVFAPAVSTLLNSLAGTGAAGFAGVAFDAQGDLFFETNTLPSTNPNSIYECNTSCIASSSATPKLIYADTASVGALQVDPWGNIFFVDGANGSGGTTNLNELPLKSGAYPSTPTVILSYKNSAGYSNGISGLAISGDGTIYFSTNADGIFAIPNSSSGVDLSGTYIVTTQGGKGVAVDSKGNLYGIPYNSGDVVSFIPVGHFSLGSEPVGTAAAAVTATIFDSSASCSPTENVAVKQFGVTSTDFTATAGSTCTTAYSGTNGTFSAGPMTAAAFSSYPVTLNFTPTAAGERGAVLVVADGTVSGATALTGVGQAAMANVDPGVSTMYTTGLGSPMSVVADAAGNVFVADSSVAGAILEFPAGSTSTTTPTQISLGSANSSFEPTSLTFDLNDDLFIGGSVSGVGSVIGILNANTTASPGFVPGTPQTIVSASTAFGGTALMNAAALAVGPNGTLYISDTGNKRVVYFNLATGQAGVTLAQGAIEGLTSPVGLESPKGIAVDSSGNLYIADSSLNVIFIVSSSGMVTTVAPPSTVTAATGVAVDASGSLIVADGGSANIVRIPNISGTLTVSQAVTIEAVVSPQTNSSLWMDLQGDLYVASAAGKSANVILRNEISGASINLGSVANGSSGSGPVYTENAGNETATLASTDVTEPTNTWFTLAPATTNGCTGGTTGNPGQMCAFTAQFAPPAGTTAGPYSGTGAIILSTPAVTIPVTISGTASTSSLQSQTVTFSPAPPATGYVGQQVTLTATASSGLTPVTLTSTTTNTCTLSGADSPAVVTFIAVGGCSITASQAGGSASGVSYGQATATANITVTTATPTGVPSLQMTQFNWLYPSGAFTDTENPTGGSFAVTQDGEFVVGTSYDNTVDFINVKTGALMTNGTNAAGPVAVSGPGGITIDSNNNLYISHLYNNIIYKLPFVNGAYATLTDAPSTAPPACQGGTKDTAECTFVTYPSTPAAPSPQNGGLKDIAFDPSGNFYMVTEPSEAGVGENYIFECNTKCQPAGTGVLVYSDTNGGVSQIAFDPWGNMFFTDANYLVSGSNDVSSSGASSSSLWEIPATALAGTLPVASATLLETFTNTKPGGYDDILASVTVNQTTGTIYVGTLYDGIYAIPNTQTGGPDIADQYAVSSQNAKSLALDAAGNIYLMNYGSGTDIAGNAFSGTDAAGELLMGDLTVPNAVYEGPVSTGSADLVDNAIPCTTTAALTFVSTNSDFGASAGSTCSSIGIGDATVTGATGNTLSVAPTNSTYGATITFNPLNVGAQTTTLSVTDTANGGEGTATVASFAATTPQTLALVAPAEGTNYNYSAPPNPLVIPLVASNGASNFPVTFSIDKSSKGAGTISSTTVNGSTSTATLTVTQAGTIVIDANEAGSPPLVNGVYYSPAPQEQVTVTVNPIAQSLTFAPISPTTYTYAPAPNQVTIPLSATNGASGNQVIFTVDASSTGTGTISGAASTSTTSTAMLTVTQAGTIVIDANEAANANYTAAPQVQQTITVNPAAQTITFTPPTQPIYFIAASPGITGGITVPVSATGGGSDNPIVFTVDPSSTMTGSFSASTVASGTSTSTATLTIPIQKSGATSGTIVIDATQAASTDYSAVTVTPLGTLNILPPLATQIITWVNPGTQVVGTPLTLTATASSALPIQYSSSTTTVCTVSGDTATFLTAGTCTITAAQPGNATTWAAAAPVTATFTVNPKGTVPAMTLNISIPSLTMIQGTVGTTQLTVSSVNNFAGQVTFTCSGLPSGYTCTFNPNPLTVPQGVAETTTLSINGPSSAALHHDGRRPLIPMTSLALALCFFLGFRKRDRLHLLLLALVFFAGLGLFSGCGGSSSTTTGSSTSTVTITATSGSMQQSAQMTLIVEQ